MIDTATNTVIATIPVGNCPAGVAVSPDGATAYVANLDGTVSVIDTATNTVTATITVGDGPSGVAVSPDGTRAYVTNSEDGTVSVIILSAAQLSVVAMQVVSTDMNAQVSSTPAVSMASDVVPGWWGLLDGVRRQIQHTLFNRTPTVAYNPAENSRSADGVISGDLHAVDPDGDPLTFTVTRAPERGSWWSTPTARSPTPRRDFPAPAAPIRSPSEPMMAPVTGCPGCSGSTTWCTAAP